MAKSIPKVKGMDAILARIGNSEIQPDEFTAQMVSEKSNKPINAIRGMLSRMRSNGDFTVRKITINGAPTNVYKAADK